MSNYDLIKAKFTIIVAIIHVLCANGDDSEWRDARGLSCANYTSMKLCEHGSYGPSWRYDVNKLFKHYTGKDGLHAGDKCCDCILSSSHAFVILGCETRSETDNSIWYDSLGHTCAYYTDLGWCENGSYGESWYIYVVYWYGMCSYESNIR